MFIQVMSAPQVPPDSLIPPPDYSPVPPPIYPPYEYDVYEVYYPYDPVVYPSCCDDSSSCDYSYPPCDDDSSTTCCR